ncbi:MAG: carboxypeptidase-like regulatory domain-containing protein [Candidatus Neomarinimicrobiota bacterium]
MRKRQATWLWLAVAVIAMALLSSCSVLMKARVLSVNVKVVDENNAPIKGALVEVTNGEKTTTGVDGLATLKFAGLGVHMITVVAQDRTPATLSVTMPLDIGKTFTARLGTPVEISLPISVGTTGSLAGMMMVNIYPLLFQSLFTAYGYNLELVPYKAGEWTDWNYRGAGDEQPMVMKKAFLTKLENQQEWWQMQLFGETSDETMIIEVLFSEGRQSLRRMRQKTGAEAAQEVPVTEGWYTAPMTLTPESLEGAVAEKGVSVTVPAGTFQADLLEFAAMGTGAFRMWRAQGVPGGVVRAQLVEPDGEAIWTSELKGHGTKATTELNSY